MRFPFTLNYKQSYLITQMYKEREFLRKKLVATESKLISRLYYIIDNDHMPNITSKERDKLNYIREKWIQYKHAPDEEEEELPF